jgi:hypothetical protein
LEFVEDVLLAARAAMQRIQAEIQTMSHPPEAAEAARNLMRGLAEVMKEFRLAIGQLQIQAEKNQQPGTSSTHDTQETTTE